MSCVTLLARKWEQAVAPGSAEDFEVSFDLYLRRQWESKTWILGDTIQAGAFDAECIKGGRSGAMRPDFTEVVDEEIPDGSARWKIIEPSGASLISAATFEWDAPEGIEVSGQADTDTSTTAVLGVDDELAKGQYEIMVTATAGAKVIKRPCILQVA